jgi:heat shock protein HslJ
MKIFWIATIGLCGVIALSDGKSMEPAATTPTLDGSAWVLSSLPGQSLVADATATVRFEDGRVSGSDGCNRYSMPFTADGAAIQIGPRGPSTLMACAEETMAQASVFLAALTSTRGFRHSPETLELLDGDGAVVATLAAQANSLAGVAWKVINIYNGQAIVGVLSDTTVTMVFDDEGRVSGMAGCNPYTAEYRAQGDSMRISSVAATRMACPDPAMMDQEAAFLRALELVATLRFESDRLDLLREDGSLAIILVRNL